MRKLFNYSIIQFILMIFFVGCSTELEEINLGNKNPIDLNKDNSKQTNSPSISSAFDKNFWVNMPSKRLFEIAAKTDSSFAIGFTKSGPWGSNDRSKARQHIVKMIQKKFNHPNEFEEVHRFDFLDNIIIKIQDAQILDWIRRLPFIRYVEPFNYDENLLIEPNLPQDVYQTNSTSGCNLKTDNTPTGSWFDVSGINTFVSWHLVKHNVPQAWNHADGSGIRVAIMDTGISDNQAYMNNPGFNWSGTRQLYQTNISSYTNNCDHGTAVGGQIAGPVTSYGTVTGVAYNCNFNSYRVAQDVWLNLSSERSNLISGIYQAASNSSVKIINISLGFYSYNSSVKDVIDLANSYGKLVICAAGSIDYCSWCTGGIYPAKYNNTIGATGVKYQNNSGISPYIERLSNNFKGDQVDFCVYLQDETNNNEYAHGMNPSDSRKTKSKGSSSAAAFLSGAAALIWQQNQNYSRDDIISILKNASTNFRYKQGSKDSEYGWGIIDVNYAVIIAKYGIMSASIQGPSNISNAGTYSWSINTNNQGGSPSGTSYQWYWNGQLVSYSSSYSRYIDSNTDSRNSLKVEVVSEVGQEASSINTIWVSINGGGGPIQ